MTSIDDSHSSLIKAKILAELALSGDIPMLEACRKIRNEIVGLENISKDISLVFIGIDSECDDYPSGDERNHWNPLSLAEKDAEMGLYSIQVEPVLKEAMINLIAM